jgi:hypothetical protein
LCDGPLRAGVGVLVCVPGRAVCAWPGCVCLSGLCVPECAVCA